MGIYEYVKTLLADSLVVEARCIFIENCYRLKVYISSPDSHVEVLNPQCDGIFVMGPFGGH